MGKRTNVAKNGGHLRAAVEGVTFSVVTTVKNEEDSIAMLLDSLINQSRLPVEVIVVDAGSTDQTIDLINNKKEAFKHEGADLKVIQAEGVNRSKGRNIGIVAAVCDYIAVTDAGCVADKDWLLELSAGFIKEIDSVAGFYLPVIKKPIQKLFAEYVAIQATDFDPLTYLPSSRSIAFHKKAWTEVGTYPEQLETCEDLVFAKALKLKGTMAVQQKALVYWNQADSLEEFFHQIQGYAQGDVMARYMPHVRRIVTVWLRYALFLIFPPLFILYIAFVFLKHQSAVNDVSQAVMIPVVQIVTDWGIMTGSVKGFFSIPVAGKNIVSE